MSDRSIGVSWRTSENWSTFFTMKLSPSWPHATMDGSEFETMWYVSTKSRILWLGRILIGLTTRAGKWLCDHSLERNGFNWWCFFDEDFFDALFVVLSGFSPVAFIVLLLLLCRVIVKLDEIMKMSRMTDSWKVTMRETLEKNAETCSEKSENMSDVRISKLHSSTVLCTYVVVYLHSMYVK